MMDKEWLYVIIFVLVPALVFIVSMVNIAQWFFKVKSGEINRPMLPYRYYKEHPEEFSIEHTYSIVKGSVGQNISKKERKIVFWTMCPMFLAVIVMLFSSQWSTWVEKIIPFEVICYLEIICMVSVSVLFLIGVVSLDTKVWRCPYCKKKMMRVELSSEESREYMYDSKAIFVRHRWGGRNLLLVTDYCPFCKKSFAGSDHAAPHDEKEYLEKQLHDRGE